MADFRQRPRRRLWPWVLLLVVALVFGYPLLLAGRIYCAGQQDDARQADVIIVLGAAQYNGHPSPVYQARLDHALELYQEGYARYLLFTGGRRPGDPYTEAGVGRSYAMLHGVSPRQILVEPEGRTTLESLRAATEILRDHHLQAAILVSDPFHAFRLRHMARDLGMVATVSPTPSSRVRSVKLQAHYIGREMVVYALYCLFRV